MKRNSQKKRNRQSEKGAVAVLTAALLMGAVMATAAAVDIGKAMYVRSNLQKAVDSAVKAAAVDSIVETTGVTDEQITEQLRKTAKAYISANALSPSTSGYGLVDYDLNKASDFSAVYTPADPNNANVGDEDTVSVTLKGSVPVTFYKMFASAIPVTVTSTAKRPRPSPVELVIALDATSSMGDPLTTNPPVTKLAALKTAAKNLVDQLMKWDNVKIGLVPFSGFIRINSSTSSYFNATSQTSLQKWLTFTPRTPYSQKTITVTENQCQGWTATNCKTVTTTTWCYKDGIPYSCTHTSTQCTNVCTGGWKQVTYTKVITTNPETWYGCLWYRQPPESTTIVNTVAKPYYGMWNNNNCGTAVTDLVSSTDTFTVNNQQVKAPDWLKARIDALALHTSGLTYIPAGLVWAWNMLTTETTTPGGTVIDNDYPLNSGFTSAQVKLRDVRKSLVLITDGENTGFPVKANNLFDSMDMIWKMSYTPAQRQANLKRSEDDTKAVCANVKNSKIAIYVVALQVDPTSSYYALLRDNCASGSVANKSDFFFDVTTAADLNNAFKKIGAAQAYNTITK
ncbi:MAG: TadE/TadG family protein [Aestuariivirga sp.]|uniref:pilus assembly protein n=1 Tax=Aestuariivirga sp. TaxID=2650926 RepID=UPI0025BA29AC|nr:pilus assembly protein [Aestuariivirga sp.]MCA3559979.1 TadE/TadG family protein [Aestuariivirga sp.]